MKVSTVLAVLVYFLGAAAKLFSEESLSRDLMPSSGFRCLAEMPSFTGAVAQKDRAARNSLQPIRTYRLAVAASGEYTQFHGGTTETALVAISNLVVRLNEIYLREIGIRFALVTNNSLVIFTNKDTDPFTLNSPASATLDEAQRAFDEKLGNNGYDLGILLNTGTYGLAVLSSICDSKFKGSACMGLPQPDGEMFSIFVAHEIAHQFGATHTFNDNTGFCSGNRNPAAAVEPGTGTTLMSYAGLGCGGSLLPYMNDYFHANSIAEMLTFIEDTTLCGTFLLTSNHIPSVFASRDHVIPKLTPFQLTARGSDSDDDALSFCWEEMDLGTPQSFSDPDNGSSPLFRSFPPGTNAFRIYPTLESILNNINSPGEKLPVLSRVMRFRVTVRDTQQMGAADFADTYVEVSGTAGPFRLSSHNSAEVIHGQQVVRWDIAGTTEAPINLTRVNLLLSTNGGWDFPIVLVTNTPNDGAKMVVFPNINCPNARIKVEAMDNIFFDINDADLTLIAVPVFTSIAQNGDQVTLRWTRNAGKNYQLESAPSLEAINWNIVEVPIVRDGDEMQATVLLGEGAVFFRVREF